MWLQAKSGTEFLTSGRDGFIYWWDTRKLADGKSEELELDLQDPESGPDEEKLDEECKKDTFNNRTGATCVDFESTMAII